MFRSRMRLIIAIVLVFMLSLSLATAYAGTTIISGTIPATGPTYDSQAIFGTACAPGAFPTVYTATAFQVDIAGTYSFSLLSYSGSSHYSYIYVGFNPADPGTGCLGVVSDETPGLDASISLAAGTVYYLVSDNDSSGESTFAVEVSGPGNVTIGVSGPAAFNDGRLNNNDQWATFALYCDASSIEVYAIDSAGAGHLAFTTTQAEIDKLGVPDANTVLETAMGIRLFRLSSGEFQVVGAADAEGKVYNVRFGGCPTTPGDVTTFMTL